MRTLALAVLLLAGVGPPAAAQQPPLRIGVIATLSGSFADAAKLSMAVAKAFWQTHGDAVAGRKVEIYYRDDTGLAPDVARRMAQELVVQEHVDFVVGFTFSANVMSAGDITTSSKTPVLITNASVSGLMNKYPYMTRFSYTEEQITTALAQWALRNHIKTVYSVYLNIGGGEDAKNGFAKAFTAGGGQIVGDVSLPITTGDFSTYVERIKEAHPQAVFAFLSVAGRGFLRAFKGAGLDTMGIKVLATGDMVAEESLKATGSLADGLITAMNYSNVHDSKLNRDVKALVRSADPTAPLLDFGGVATWDAMHAIYNVVDAQKGTLDPDKTMSLLKGMRFESPRGPIYIDPVTRDIVQNMYIRRTEFRNGEWDNVELESVPMLKDPLEK